MTLTPPSLDVVALQSCALCDTPFVDHESVVLYEEAEVPVFVFCGLCARLVAVPPGGRLLPVTYGES